MQATDEAFARHLRLRYDLTPDDVEPSSPGYWRVKGGCPGGADCLHAFRGEAGPCNGGGKLTLYYDGEESDDER